jgi:hypothetical protein
MEEFKNQTVMFDGEHLKKTFDDKGRVIEIEFLLTGKKCRIEYGDEFYKTKNIRHVIWSDGYMYFSHDNTCNDEIVSHACVETKNPNNEIITFMTLDTRGKLLSYEQVLHGKTIFERKTGDWGFDGRLRYNERYITMAHKEG